MRWVQLCSSLNIIWHCFSLGLAWKLTFTSPMDTWHEKVTHEKVCSHSRLYLDPLSTRAREGSALSWLSTAAFIPQFVAQVVKNPPAMQETWVQSPGWEDPLEKGKATHSSILAWRIPWTVWSMGLQRVRHDWVTFTFTFSTFMENLFSFGVNAAH